MTSIKPETCRAARALLGWNQGRLAGAARVAESTVKKFETGRTPLIPATAAALERAFEAAGVEFIPDEGGGAGVRFRRPNGEPRAAAEGC